MNDNQKSEQMEKIKGLIAALRSAHYAIGYATGYGGIPGGDVDRLKEDAKLINKELGEAVHALSTDAQAEQKADEREDLADMVSKALRRAWQLGQTYWQQANSESYSQNRKSDDTQKKFEQLVDETRDAISQSNKENKNG